MGHASRDIATTLLAAAADGNEAAAEQLLPLVYDELRELARSWLAKEPPGHTLPPMALVHEVYLRLIGDQTVNWANRAHFFAAAAQAMRRILVEHARARGARKRGGDRQRVGADEAPAIWQPPGLDLVALDEALSKLERRDPRASEVVMLRHFGGLSIDDTAAALDISPRTVVREWRCARAWLVGEIAKGDTSFVTGEGDGQQ
ncbi:MAG: ECF-type sigma factor [Phycisphaerales bacterium]|nr:ECF-type sigma factor [Phycisphaerales bacterium]